MRLGSAEPSLSGDAMKVDRTETGGAVIALDGKEAALLRLALERATFVDTPPGRQSEIFRFAEDLLKVIPR